MKLLIATKNKGKFDEISRVITSIKPEWELISLQDLSIDIDIPEDGSTAEENAFIKAKMYAEESSMITIADDTTVEIDAFDGAPGLFPRRWPNMQRGVEGDSTDAEILSFWTDAISNLPQEAIKSGRYKSLLCLFDPATSAYLMNEGNAEFNIASMPSATVIEGFPYDSIFTDPTTGKFLCELTEDEAEARSHRSIALRNLVKTVERLTS